MLFSKKSAKNPITSPFTILQECWKKAILKTSFLVANEMSDGIPNFILYEIFFKISGIVKRLIESKVISSRKSLDG